MERQRLLQFRSPVTKKIIWATLAFVLIIGLTMCGLVMWKNNQPRWLLPESIQTANFEPYFYYDKLPAGYSLDEQKISFNGQIILMPLIKPGHPTIVLTEQPLPDNLPEDLQKGGKTVEGTVMPATITDMGERKIGVMVTPTALILLTLPNDGDASELVELLQGLRPAS